MKKLLIIIVVALLASCTKEHSYLPEPKPADKSIEKKVKQLEGFHSESL